jgi:outer membrane immunogenic protein
MYAKSIMATAAAALAITISPASAADIMRGSSFGPAAAPVVGYNWSGAYIGANLGYQWGSATHSNTSPNGVAGGIQGGYNVQMGQFVFGAETDFQLSDASDRFANWKYSNPWFGTLRARAGYAMNNILFFATLGMAYGGGRVDPGGWAESNTHVGWTVGGGVEVGLTPNWSAKVEYLYVDLSDQYYVALGGSTGFESSVFRLGVNYRF